MPKKALPRITAVAVGNEPFSLTIHWAHGGENTIDVSKQINTYRLYAPLRQSKELFRRVRVGDFGTDVVWSDEIDMAAEMLWRLAQEQSGQTMTAEAFREWREKNDYTLDDAAVALGISRRMVAYYERGNQPIPRLVALATRALNHMTIH